MTAALGYVPMPASVIDLVEKTWARELTERRRKLWPTDKRAQKRNREGT